MIEFRNSPEAAIQTSKYISAQINQVLASNKKVLWLVAGGSAMKVAREAVGRLNGKLSNLTITLTDERYGEVGHANSNWKQLEDINFFPGNSRLAPVLRGEDFKTTARYFEETLNKEIEVADYSIALAGIGSDGHIFGIKSGSPSVASRQDVISYKWDDYHRITPTIQLIRKLDEVVVYAVGGEKSRELKKLLEDIPAAEQPAQLLKDLPKVIIYNDQIGETS